MKLTPTLLAIALLAAPSAYANGLGGNQAFIDQTNANNAQIDQECSAGGCDNIAGITQVYQDFQGAPGALNSARINQVTSGNEGYITQDGNNNSAEIDQRNNAYADIQQVGAFDSQAKINQDKDEIDGTLAGANNIAGITQSGLVQSALIKQFGDDGSAHVTQSGDDNYAKVIQNQGSIGESVRITQDGWGNYADTVQNGQGDSIIIGQSGMKNVMDVDVAVTSRGSSITAFQTGTGNDAKIFTQGENNRVQGSQNDTDNFVEVVQLGNDQLAGYTQDGVNNNAFIGQYESATGSVAAINQFGTGHNASIFQHCAQSTANITQRGAGAHAVIRQQ